MSLRAMTLATAFAFACVPAFAQTPAAPQTQPPRTTGVAPATGPISTPDFVNKVVMGDMFDTQAARIAVQKGDTSEKPFAQKEITDHTKLTDEIKSMASAGKVHATVPTALDREHQQKLDRLQTLSGKQFDDAYNKGAVESHESMVGLLQQYAQNGDNGDLKQWSSKMLPELSQHLSGAQKLK